MRFSGKTLSLLTQLIQCKYSTHNDIELLIQEFDLIEKIQATSASDKARWFVQFLGQEANQDSQKEKKINELIERVIGNLTVVNLHSGRTSIYNQFKESLMLDGFVINESLRLLPHTPEPASLSPQLSKLEQNLECYRLSVALAHFQQAYRSFTDGQYESCNAQIRSFTENLIQEICKKITGKEFPNNPPAALQNLQQNSKIDHHEEGMFRNFWSHIQDEGPHQGLTSPSEALYRLHMATVMARYLMEKLLEAS